MARTVLCTIFLAIAFFNLLSASSARICYKEKFINYTVATMTSSQKLKIETRNHTASIPVCCEGYKNIGAEDVLPPKCTPVCNPPCGNGRCSAPDHCSCDLGYKQSEHGNCVADNQVPVALTSTPSKPSCNPPCGEGGICYLTNRCACLEGYVLSDSETCVADESATDRQTTTSTSTSTSTTVHPTVRSMTSGSQCGPCHMGTCLMDIFCVCSTGYNLTAEGNCEPICSQPCGSGRCVAPNMCECADGYAFDSESGQCKPMCNGKIYGCIRGTCVGYNQCHCDSGTMLQRNELFECIAVVDSPSPIEEGSLTWLWVLLGISIPAAALAVSFYIIIRRSRYALANRMDGEHESNYVFSSNNPATNINDQLAKHTNGYTMGEINFREDTIGRTGNVVIINT